MRVLIARCASACTVIGFVCLLAPSGARADARVITLDGRDWPDVVTGFEADVHSQGHSVSLCVRDDAMGVCLPCGSYTLAFDEIGAQAFAVSACDPASRATQVTLVDRSVLFDHSHTVPRPRAITVRAAIVSAIETSGGAASTGGSALGCTARVRPYLRDLEHGTNVYLGPDEYDVHVTAMGVDVSMLGNGWMLASESRVASDVGYDVIERSSGETVMTGHASLECVSETQTTIDDPSTVRAGGTETGGFAVGFGVREGVSGLAGGPSHSLVHLGANCIGSYPNEPQHVIDAAMPLGAITIHAGHTRTDLTLAVRTPDGAWHCNDDGGVAPSVLDPIVALTSVPQGRTEVYVGTYSGQIGVPYQLDVHEVALRHRHRPQPGLLAAGVLLQTFSWVFMSAFDAIPDVLCTHASACPNDEWRSIAWIPLVGPWIANGVAGANGATFTAPAIADGVIQDVGLLFVIISLIAEQDYVVPSVALGEGASAPRLALGGGAGSSIGATLTF